MPRGTSFVHGKRTIWTLKGIVFQAFEMILMFQLYVKELIFCMKRGKTRQQQKFLSPYLRTYLCSSQGVPIPIFCPLEPFDVKLDSQGHRSISDWGLHDLGLKTFRAGREIKRPNEIRPPSPFVKDQIQPGLNSIFNDKATQRGSDGFLGLSFVPTFCPLNCSWTRVQFGIRNSNPISIAFPQFLPLM